MPSFGCKVTARLLGAGMAALILAAGAARGQDQTTLDLQAPMEKVEKENAELKQQLLAGTQGAAQPAAGVEQLPAVNALTRKDVEKIVSDKLKDEAAKKKAADEQKKQEEASKWYQVGTEMGVKAEFRDGLFLWLSTPNNDFTMHIGEWMQYDNVFWTQSASPNLRASPDGRPGAKQGVASGAALGGIGDLQDGTYFRRIRPFLEGTFWETGEYRLILALENDQFSTTGLDEFWVALKDIPLIGTVRVGHVKTPMGLEADMTASSRTMTFMERSSYSEAIELNQNFVTGLWASNNYFDERATWSAAIFRQDLSSSTGVFFGDGQYGAQGRLTALPIYECNGRHLLHVGISGGWRNGTNNLAVSPFRTFQLRARPELRDSDPAADPAGAQPVPNANDNRMIDTGSIVASNDWLMGLELLYIWGPLSVQAEYGWNWIDNAIGFAPVGGTLNPALATAQNYVFNGGYVQLAYTLTGENRAYDKRIGTLDRYYYGIKGPYSPAWLVRDADGNLCCGPGAWEIAARYSYVNLNDGTGLNRIAGGAMDGISVALNWYLNNNLSVMFDWVYNHRYDLASGVVPGYTQGYGMRVQMSF
jgi:phosphate-selective porin OprO/OprP